MKFARASRQALAIAIMGSATLCMAQSSTNSDATPTRLQEVTVTATNTLKEDALMGPNQQPEWTARRRWTTTRVYVQPPWQIETEIGLDSTFPRQGKPEHLLQEEIELGLPHRFQVDFENHDQNFEEDQGAGDWHHDSNSLELGYAFADWGRIPLNPTIKGEWKFNDGAADTYEIQALFGDEFTERLHWGLNLFFEHQVGDDRHQEMAASQAISYTLIDEKLSAGTEMKFSAESDKDSRNDPEKSFEIGPSFQWRPTKRTHLDVTPLFGIGHDAPQAELLIFFGVEFGPGSKGNEGLVPTSFRGK
jgi:hypothetical protein